MNSAGRENPTTATVGNASSIANTGIGASMVCSRRPRVRQSRETTPVARRPAAARQAPRPMSAPPSTAATISVRARVSSVSAGSYRRKIGSAMANAQTAAPMPGSIRRRNRSAARGPGAYRSRRRISAGEAQAIAADVSVATMAKQDKVIAAADNQ